MRTSIIRADARPSSVIGADWQPPSRMTCSTGGCRNVATILLNLVDLCDECVCETLGITERRRLKVS
jgi:hypothetical protein